jgi:hypothetical protein
MKTCNNPDEAFHYDCEICQEQCQFSKKTLKRSFLSTISLGIAIFGGLLYLIVG